MTPDKIDRILFWASVWACGFMALAILGVVIRRG